MTLIYEEFKLMVRGACYKSTYDVSFQFEWSDEPKLAVKKVEQTIYELTAEQRRIFLQQIKGLTLVAAP